jgi:hypothetical protein
MAVRFLASAATFSMTAFRIMAVSIISFNVALKMYYAEWFFFTLSDVVLVLNVVMLSVVMLSVVMLNVVMLSVVMLSVVMLSAVMLSVVTLIVVMMSVIMPSVVAPSASFFMNTLSNKNKTLKRI